MELISGSSLGNTVINIHKQIQQTQSTINDLQRQLQNNSNKDTEIRNNYSTQVTAAYAVCTPLFPTCPCRGSRNCICPTHSIEYDTCVSQAESKRDSLQRELNINMAQVENERRNINNQISSQQTTMQSYVKNFEELTGIAYTDFVKAVEISDRNNLSLNDVFPSLAQRLNIVDPSTIHQVIAPSIPTAQIQPPIESKPIEKTIDTVIEERKQTEAVVNNVNNNMPVLGILAAGAFILGAAIFGGRRQ